MAAPKWKTLVGVSPERGYLALISYLPLKRIWTIPRFLVYTRAIETQLRAATGLVGCALRAKLLSGKFWTLSVWEDEPALMEFVRKVPHGRVMVALTPHMGQTRFLRWKLSGSEVPPTWEDALQRLESS